MIKFATNLKLLTREYDSRQSVKTNSDLVDSSKESLMIWLTSLELYSMI